MSGRKSKRKGAAGEREIAKILRDHGFEGAHRGRQYSGGLDSPDVVGLPGFHVEVKRCERLSIYKAMVQAIEDAPCPGEDDEIFPTPVVFHRRNGLDWLAILPLDEFLELVKEAQ